MSCPACKLVALDGNGTLLQEDGLTISDYTRDVLGKIQDLGIPVVLVTGRGLEKARPTLECVDLREFVITENGARVVRIKDGTSVHELWVEGQEAAAPIKRIREVFGEAVKFSQLSSDGGLIEESHSWLAGDQADEARKLFKHIVPDIPSVLEGRKCAKSYATVADSEDFESTIEEMQKAAGSDWSVRQIKKLLPGGTTNTCEVQSNRVNKADGLKALCDAIQIDVANVWAFGDDSNDIRMLKEMGWGVRMKNHTPGLDGVGDDTTDFTNEEDGVAKYLEKNLLASVVKPV
mmetsp:Transcript_30655/g.66057  ORF Transcript_30655/g.66057 Transcript_30655/m.66057 type:complete len:291 (-) Transcript_30655:7-879(-)